MSCMGCLGNAALWSLAAFGAVVVASAGLRSCGTITGNPHTDIVENSRDVYEKYIGDERQFDDKQTPTGSCTVDFLSKKGPNKRIVFDVLGRDEFGDIKVKTKEIGSYRTTLGGTARFNVIFWDATAPEKKGLAFQVALNDTTGLAIREYDAGLPAVLLSDGERVCGELGAGRRVVFKGTKIVPNLAKTSVIDRSESVVSERFLDISQDIINQHQKYGVLQFNTTPPKSRSSRDSR